jgi:hypothetical protein
MHIVPAVLVVKNLAVSGHQHRHRIRQEQHLRRHGPGCAIQPLAANPRILQLHRVHQMMEGYVGIASAQASKQGSQKAAERNEGITAKGAKEQVEPDHIWPHRSKRLHQTDHTAWIVK